MEKDTVLSRQDRVPKDLGMINKVFHAQAFPGSERSTGSRASVGFAAVLTLAALCAILTCEAPEAPAVCGALAQQTITVGESTTVTACFDDPGGNTLSFKVWSSDQSVVAVTGSGATITVTAVSPGNALVTILADNSYGLKAQQSVSVLVPNRPPLAIGEIANREVTVGDSATVDVAGYFNEPDGQGLTYTAAADSSVLSASIAGSVLTVVATAKGTATVTLTATDPGGMKAVQSFLVMVPNRPPLAEGSVPEQTIEVADSAMVDMSPFFNDPDGDALSYAVVASDTLVAAARVAESMITVDAVAKGEATVTVSADNIWYVLLSNDLQEHGDSSLPHLIPRLERESMGRYGTTSRPGPLNRDPARTPPGAPRPGDPTSSRVANSPDSTREGDHLSVTARRLPSLAERPHHLTVLRVMGITECVSMVDLPTAPDRAFFA